MTIKLNSYILPDSTIKKMEDILGKALTTGNEHGFNLCVKKQLKLLKKQLKLSKKQLKLSSEDKKIIKHGNVCEGEECSMDSSKFTCKENERTIGIFHTHKKLSDPSMSDLSVGYLVGMNCIGSPKDIKCFSRKKDFDALVFADIKIVQSKEEQVKLYHSRWKNKEINTKEYTKIYSEYKKEVDRIINDHFEETKIKQS